MNRRSFITVLRYSLLAGILGTGAHAWRNGRIRLFSRSACPGGGCGQCPVLPECDRAQAAEYRAAPAKDNMIVD